MPVNPTAPRPWERLLLAGLMVVLALLGCGATAWNAARLGALGGVPWAYAGATLDPGLIPTLSPTPTPVPPTATPTARPTVASTALACADDPVEFVSIRPSAGTIIEIGRTSLSATARYCLGSRAQAQIGIGLIPWGEGVEPVYIPFSELSVVSAGEGLITRRINWAEFFFNPIQPGTYRFVVVMVDEFGTLVSSEGSEEYTFQNPPTTDTPAP